MSELNIKSIIRNIEQNENTIIECIGYKENNKISYKENNMNVTIFIHNNKIEIIRENDVYKLNLNFELNKSYGILELKDNNFKFDLDIDLKELSIQDNKIEINYKLDCEYLYTLEYNIKE